MRHRRRVREHDDDRAVQTRVFTRFPGTSSGSFYATNAIVGPAARALVPRRRVSTTCVSSSRAHVVMMLSLRGRHECVVQLSADVRGRPPRDRVIESRRTATSAVRSIGKNRFSPSTTRVGVTSQRTRFHSRRRCCFRRCRCLREYARERPREEFNEWIES